MRQRFLIALVLSIVASQCVQADTQLNAAIAAVERATSDFGYKQDKRIALVIGNGDYQNRALDNAQRDARLMSGILGQLGFEVTQVENANQRQMQEALRAFEQRLSGGGTGLFYFAGHGMRVGSKTLLAPTDISDGSPEQLLVTGVDLTQVLASMSRPRPGKANLLILDTCLNNPFRSGAGADVSLPDQTLIAYATAPGSLAADNAQFGLYTEQLARSLSVPASSISEVFARVGAAVRRATDGRQAPWISSSLSSDFQLGTASGYLRSPAPRGAMTVVATRGRGILPKESAYELAFWESIKDSTHASDYEAYLQAYPKGRFAALARSRIERLRAAESKGEAATKRAKPATPPEPQPKPAQPAPQPAKAPEAARPAATAPPTPQQPERPAKAPEPVRAAPVPPPPIGQHPQASQGTSGEITDCAECPTLVGLQPGSFTMGDNSSDPSERPAHKVTISAPFAIGKYEVTVEQWNACVTAGACPRVSPEFNRVANAPVRDVSWDDAQLYVRWLRGVTGKPYRLPTEAEWEYAARGGTSTAYWWGAQMRSGAAICKGCGEQSTREEPAAVGSATANPYGLFDVNGNVWEWVTDCWHNSYKGAPADGSAWEEHDCRARVIRGGSWRNGPSYMLSSTRFKYDANVRFSEYGFRVARPLK